MKAWACFSVLAVLTTLAVACGAKEPTPARPPSLAASPTPTPTQVLVSTPAQAPTPLRVATPTPGVVARPELTPTRTTRAAQDKIGNWKIDPLRAIASASSKDGWTRIEWLFSVENTSNQLLILQDFLGNAKLNARWKEFSYEGKFTYAGSPACIPARDRDTGSTTCDPNHLSSPFVDAILVPPLYRILLRGEVEVPTGAVSETKFQLGDSKTTLSLSAQQAAVSGPVFPTAAQGQLKVGDTFSFDNLWTFQVINVQPTEDFLDRSFFYNPGRSGRVKPIKVELSLKNLSGYDQALDRLYFQMMDPKGNISPVTAKNPPGVIGPLKEARVSLDFSVSEPVSGDFHLVVVVLDPSSIPAYSLISPPPTMEPQVASRVKPAKHFVVRFPLSVDMPEQQAMSFETSDSITHARVKQDQSGRNTLILGFYSDSRTAHVDLETGKVVAHGTYKQDFEVTSLYGRVAGDITILSGTDYATDGETVYARGYNTRRQDFLVAFDRTTTAVKWVVEVEAGQRGLLYPLFTLGRYLFAHQYWTDDLYRFDAGSGRLEGVFKLQGRPDQSGVAAFAGHGRAVYFLGSQRVVSFDVESGQVNWETQLPGQRWGRPVFLDNGGLYLVTYKAIKPGTQWHTGVLVSGIDPATGQTYWSFPWSDVYTGGIGRPISILGAERNLIIIGDGVLALRPPSPSAPASRALSLAASVIAREMYGDAVNVPLPEPNLIQNVFPSEEVKMVESLRLHVRVDVTLQGQPARGAEVFLHSPEGPRLGTTDQTGKVNLVLPVLFYGEPSGEQVQIFVPPAPAPRKVSIAVRYQGQTESIELELFKAERLRSRTIVVDKQVRDAYVANTLLLKRLQTAAELPAQLKLLGVVLTGLKIWSINEAAPEVGDALVVETWRVSVPGQPQMYGFSQGLERGGQTLLNQTTWTQDESVIKTLERRYFGEIT